MDNLISKTNYLEQAKELRDSLGKTKDYTRTSQIDIFLDAEAIISSLAYLLSPMLELEGIYRQLLVTLMADGDSHAAAEAKAKANEVYRDWKKIQGIYALGEEQLKVLKKFVSALEGEYKRA